MGFLQSQGLAASVSTEGQQEKMKYLQDENLMRKISQKLGGINPEMLKQLTEINNTSVSLHDAARRGDLQKVQEFLKDGKDVNSKDFKGVTPLGYAVGHDQLSTVKVLIMRRRTSTTWTAPGTARCISRLDTAG